VLRACLTFLESPFIDHVNGASGSFGNRTWTGTLAGGATNTGSELGASNVGQADNRQLGADWSTWGAAGNPNPNTHPYLLYGISGVIGGTTPAADPEITSITSLPSGKFELTLKGANSTSYEFYRSETLTFPGTKVTGLTATVGTIPAGGTEVMTDVSGDATVQMSLTGSANFVRAQQ